MTDTGSPETLIDAVKHFATADAKVCHDYMVSIKWPDGIVICPKCGGDQIGKIETRLLLRCKAKGCRKQFSVKVGTIFEDSPLQLSIWFVGVWCIADAKIGISSLELARALGVNQKTAWFILHRIRLAMRTPTFRRFRDVAANMHASKRARKIVGRGTVGKAIVHGILERGIDDKVSQVRATVVPDTEADTRILEVFHAVDVDLAANVFERVVNGVMVESDETFNGVMDELRGSHAARSQETDYLPRIVRPGRCGIFGGNAMKQPLGGSAFDRLLQQLVQVPKKELRRVEKRDEKKKPKRTKK